jgi:hypothetical protein
MRRVAAPVIAVLVGGCSPRTKPVPDREEGRRTISEGYSLLYFATGEQKWADKVLLVKFESEELKRLVTRIAKYAGDLRGRLEDLAKRYPAIHLEPPPPTELEQRARRAQYHERLKDMLLESGPEFERDMLLTQYCSLDELRHLASVMGEIETDANRRAFWQEVQREFDEEYRQVVGILQHRHFRGASKRAARY